MKLLSDKKIDVCLDIFSERLPRRGSILVSDHLH